MRKSSRRLEENYTLQTENQGKYSKQTFHQKLSESEENEVVSVNSDFIPQGKYFSLMKGNQRPLQTKTGRIQCQQKYTAINLKGNHKETNLKKEKELEKSCVIVNIKLFFLMTYLNQK